MNKRLNQYGGFTLIEVLIALAIVAILAVQLSSAGEQVIRQQTKLENKSVAHWIALNKWTLLQASQQWLEIGEQTERIEMANQQWAVRTRVEASQQPHFRLVHIDVGLDDEHQDKFSKISGVLGLIGEPLTP